VTATANHPKPRILAVVGLAGTGKSTAVELLRQRLGGSVVYFGGIVLDEVRRRGMATVEANERRVREELRRDGGMGAIATLAVPVIESALRDTGPDSIGLIDGLYSGAELDVLRSAFGDSIQCLAVHCRRSIRERRVARRPVRPLTPAELLERDITEIRALDKATPIALADYHVVNDGTLEELAAALDAAVSQLRADPERPGGQ
jgi:dephospho-CoA kinase